MKNMTLSNPIPNHTIRQRQLKVLLTYEPNDYIVLSILSLISVGFHKADVLTMFYLYPNILIYYVPTINVFTT